ncbi:thrombopoietin isoform X5 [Rissa tridactyla]|uniref:thrombopoietin isoform X5 n=1 Tax=Rissa tridactyla TaxID=75485 RepID=UPI0023BADF97|nr:thrombopoietin isoform X5 [Rissa tridactyla]
MQDRSPQLSMELNRLLLLTSFLLHVEEGHASPVRLVCDSRLIHKYIGEAKDMEKTVVRIHPPPQKPQGREGRSSWRLTSASPLPAQGQCQALPALGCPAVLPLVNFSLQQWKCKSAGPWEPGCSPHSVEQTHVTSIFLTYRKLVQGKLSFFFHNLAKDSCKPGQGGGREPHCGAR